jgi:hypothetical protein
MFVFCPNAPSELLNIEKEIAVLSDKPANEIYFEFLPELFA